MHTHTPTQIVFTTPRGEPYRPSHIVAAHFGKSPTSLRISMDNGEVIPAHYQDEAEATRALERIHHAMSGIVDTSPDMLPDWATAENAKIVADTVLQQGGTRERAAQAFARTIMGIGQPASVIDTDAINEQWLAADAGDGPVLVLAGMPDPDHGDTEAPFTLRSPLVRLALLAVNRGVDPRRLVFSIPMVDGPADGGPGNSPARTVQRFVVGNAYTTGEAGLDVSSVHVPRRSYHWCALNSAFFLDWVAASGGPLVRVDGGMSPAEYDSDNDAHVLAMTKIAEHFDVMGWTSAASQLRSELP